MISVTGLVDTGNQLYHPLSKKPVIIVEAQYLESIVPQMVMSFIRNIDQLGEAKLDDVDNKWLSRLSMMPYRGVGQKMGMLCTIQPDQVIIKAENGEYKTSHVLLGGSEGILSSEGLYQAIVHPDVLMESRTGDFDYGEAVKC
jgi:stage II sporulation protein GA (sporulation sigma-E factor processing peptidase)